MKLKLKRPIIFFDLETTGTNITKDRIVQIAAIKIDAEWNMTKKDMLLNPGRAIPKEATEIHGITDEMVKDKPTFAQIAKAMSQWFFGCDLGGYNSNNFDIPLLSEEFNRVDIKFPMDDVKFVDVLKIEALVNTRKLTDVYKRYTGEELDDAHNALKDTFATIQVFKHQLALHELPESVEDLDYYCTEGKERVDIAGKLYKNEKGEICYSFGKSKGMAVKDDPGFGRWMLNWENDFPSNTKEILKSLLSKL